MQHLACWLGCVPLLYICWLNWYVISSVIFLFANLHMCIVSDLVLFHLGPTGYNIFGIASWFIHVHLIELDIFMCTPGCTY